MSRAKWHLLRMTRSLVALRQVSMISCAAENVTHRNRGPRASPKRSTRRVSDDETSHGKRAAGRRVRAQRLQQCHGGRPIALGGHAELAHPWPRGLDTTFGSGGILKSAISATENDRFLSATSDADGNIFAVGWVQVSGDNQMALAKFTPDGAPDASFGTNGVATVNVASGGKAAELGRAVDIQSDGKIIIGGPVEHDTTATGDAARDTDFAVVRFDADGKLDPDVRRRGHRQDRRRHGQGDLRDRVRGRLVVGPRLHRRRPGRHLRIDAVEGRRRPHRPRLRPRRPDHGRGARPRVRRRRPADPRRGRRSQPAPRDRPARRQDRRHRLFRDRWRRPHRDRPRLDRRRPRRRRSGRAAWP